MDAGIEEIAPELGSLSGRFFMDNNDNDQDDAGDMGLEGIVVTLVETGATTTTDAEGNYSFGDLPAGDYSVTFTDPNGVLDGKELVEANVGPDATDSDATGDTDLSTIEGITVVAGEDTPDNDVGVEDIAPELGSLSGRFFMDNNDNDQDDAGDMGLEGIVVTLVETGATTTTDAEGNYSFGDLPAGDYSVTFTDPNGVLDGKELVCLLYTSPSPRDLSTSRMPSSA